jgi:hypothetical protein
LPNPQTGNETATFDLCPSPRLAHHLVAGLESPPGEDLFICRPGGHEGLNQVVLTNTNYPKPYQNSKGEKMENTRKSTFDLVAIAWGAFFILWGISELFPSLPKGTGAIGIGAILVGLNLARSRKGQPTSGFTTTFGILALLLGGLQLASPYLQLPFELPVFAILLLALGSITLIGALKN